MSAALTMEEVDLYVASRRKGLRFPPRIEALFDAQRKNYRARALRALMLPSLACYNCFLPVDCFLLPATARIAIGLHALVSAWIVTAALLLRTKPSLVLREALGVSIPMLMVAQILAVCVLNRGTSAVVPYHQLAVMIVVYMNVNQRPDFRFALVTSLLILAGYGIFLFTQPFDVSTRFVGAGSMAAAVYLGLNATWRMERDARYTFLMRLRDRLRCEVAEAEADRDALTGLFNRRFLAERADEIWSKTEPDIAVAIIMLDVDHFKSFNDRYGHPAGDLCLKRIAGAVQAKLRGRTTSSPAMAAKNSSFFCPAPTVRPR